MKRSYATYLNEVNAHEKDAFITFEEEGHIYKVDFLLSGEPKEDKDIISVTKFVHYFFNEFNADEVIDKMQKSKNWPKSKYFKMDKEEIKAMWAKKGKDSSNLGTIMHAFIESYYNEEKSFSTETEEAIEIKYFIEFDQKVVKEQGLIPYRPEMRVFTDEKTKITGSIDMIFVAHDFELSRDELLHIVIYDWKRIEALNTFNKFSKGKGPFCEFQECNFSIYSAQLNVYKYILENYYQNVPFRGKKYKGFKVDNLYLLILHPKNKTYKLALLPNLQKEVKEMFQSREEVLSGLKKNLCDPLISAPLSKEEKEQKENLEFFI